MFLETIKLAVHGLAHDGRGVGRTEDGRVVFTQGALPGQTVTAGIVKSKKNFSEAELVEILVEAPDALPAPCPHHGECGGCPLQTMPATRQLFWKESFVREALKRIGHIAEDMVEPILPPPTPWNYRNKVEFAFGSTPAGRSVIGMRKEKSHEIFDISSCLLLPCAEVTDFVRQRADGASGWRKFTVRRGLDDDGREKFLAALTTDPGTREQKERVAAFGRELLEKLPSVAGFAHLESNGKSSGTVCILGRSGLYANVAGLSFTMAQNSFFQVNSGAASIMCRKAAEYAALKGGETLWDLYCGGGLLGLALLHDLRGRVKDAVAPGADAEGQDGSADKTHTPGAAEGPCAETRLYGVESNAEAVKIAIADAKRHGLRNSRFISGEVHKLAPSLPRPDVVLVDPPRGGMHPGAVKTILKFRPARLVLVSCNPATLARDVAALEQGYRLVKVSPIDLFPQTSHVESVALLLANAT